MVDFLSWMQAIPRTLIQLIPPIKIFNFTITTAMICAGGLMVTLWHYHDPAVTPRWHHCDPAVTPLWPAHDITKSFIKSLRASGWDHTHPDTQSNQDGHYSSRRREFSMIRLALIGAHFLSAFPPQFVGMASLGLWHLPYELMASSCLWSRYDESSGHALASGAGIKVARCPIP